MFSVMVEELTRGIKPDTGPLKKRFDAAMTKKLAVVKLPPAFWTLDPKINPRADHLFWASLLIGDRQRVELSISVIAAELEQNSKILHGDLQQDLAALIQRSICDFLDTINNTLYRQKLERETGELVQEYFQVNRA